MLEEGAPTILHLVFGPIEAFGPLRQERPAGETCKRYRRERPPRETAERDRRERPSREKIEYWGEAWEVRTPVDASSSLIVRVVEGNVVGLLDEIRRGV
jgi:hypothetical protein